MEFVRTAEDEEIEVLEATENVAMTGASVTKALTSFKGRKVLAFGAEAGRLWVRLAKKGGK